MRVLSTLFVAGVSVAVALPVSAQVNEAAWKYMVDTQIASGTCDQAGQGIPVCHPEWFKWARSGTS
jgi:hypothetical protein